jgi:hypothetical protein
LPDAVTTPAGAGLSIMGCLLCAALGAAPVAESSFHPFFREIVSVDESDDADEPPTVIDER